MHPILSKNLFIIKEQVAFFKLSRKYDVFDPDTGEKILYCDEPRLGFFTKFFRMTKYKQATPFDVHVSTASGDHVLRVQRGTALFVSKVHVFDEDDQRVGGFQQKIFAIGGKFTVLGGDDQPLCQLNGNWTSWEYKFEHDGVELARVTKKWAGLGKEMLTGADNYVLTISEDVPADNPIRELIMAAVFCIDRVMKG